MKAIEIDWENVQEYHDNYHPIVDVIKQFNISRTSIETAIRHGKFVKKHFKLVHSDECKKRMAMIKKKWLEENPEKHNWKRKNKANSVPCEILKEKLRENGINFYPEFSPLKERFFSIDIAFPKDKFGIEINGNQHYDKDGRLKPYYQQRHDLIIAEGWTIEEIPCAMIWNNDFLDILLKKIKDKVGFGFDFSVEIFEYQDMLKKKRTCPTCNGVKSKNATECRKCASIKRSIAERKVKRPDKEKLEKLIQELPFTTIGKMFGVSDNAIRKWCKFYNVRP